MFVMTEMFILFLWRFYGYPKLWRTCLGLGHDPGCFVCLFVCFLFFMEVESVRLGHDPGCFLFCPVLFLFCLVLMEVESVDWGMTLAVFCFVLFFVLFSFYGGRECGIGT